MRHQHREQLGAVEAIGVEPRGLDAAQQEAQQLRRLGEYGVLQLGMQLEAVLEHGQRLEDARGVVGLRLVEAREVEHQGLEALLLYHGIDEEARAGLVEVDELVQQVDDRQHDVGVLVRQQPDERLDEVQLDGQLVEVGVGSERHQAGDRGLELHLALHEAHTVAGELEAHLLVANDLALELNQHLLEHSLVESLDLRYRYAKRADIW